MSMATSTFHWVQLLTTATLFTPASPLVRNRLPSWWVVLALPPQSIGTGGDNNTPVHRFPVVTLGINYFQKHWGKKGPKVFPTRPTSCPSIYRSGHFLQVWPNHMLTYVDMLGYFHFVKFLQPATSNEQNEAMLKLKWYFKNRKTLKRNKVEVSCFKLTEKGSTN